MTEKRLRIALAGNANVGKSVIFNQLTGLHQHIGNWPGKTVEKAEGTLHFRGYTIDVIDLPGIYSLSTFSLEELISREYIAAEKPDLVINVVDASALERNLFFTLQLIELEAPLIMALNQIDMAEKKGIKIDHKKLEEVLGIPVVPTIAVRGKGIYELLNKAIETIEKGVPRANVIKYGVEIEERIEKLIEELKGAQLKYPVRWVAIKLLEGDEQVEREIRKISPRALKLAEKLASEIERIHGHPCPTVITSERYEAAGRIAREVQRVLPGIKPLISERIHDLTTHKILGYPIMVLVVLGALQAIFTFGGFTSEILGTLLYSYKPLFESILGLGPLKVIVWGGLMEGLIANITIALPYLIPFYLILYILEDSGYLARAAFLMDTIMHKIGLHGKAFIPIMLGYGCNVPACLGCRIMETERERLLTGFVVTLIPCAARTAVILGLVGSFLGIQWALALYIINLAIVFILGRIAFKMLPGEPTALIMEMPDYKIPHAKTVLKQTWFRLWEFLKISFPLIIASSTIIKLIEMLGFLDSISKALSPITVWWLGLPEITGVILIFGVLRKELTLIMLASLLGTTDFQSILTPLQMFIFALVVMLYIPCVATIAACVREFGWRRALVIALVEILFAILAGGIIYRLMAAFNMLSG
ncbi:MAG: ferrous iron transport protein B [Candidatus Bathyarchaeia archaeon]|nr:ferrous iron transport protein B [Candidatus Bathyarchaeota archaeon]